MLRPEAQAGVICLLSDAPICPCMRKQGPGDLATGKNANRERQHMPLCAVFQKQGPDPRQKIAPFPSPETKKQRLAGPCPLFRSEGCKPVFFQGDRPWPGHVQPFFLLDSVLLPLVMNWYSLLIHSRSPHPSNSTREKQLCPGSSKRSRHPWVRSTSWPSPAFCWVASSWCTP